jgi:hypothetical protein
LIIDPASAAPPTPRARILLDDVDSTEKGFFQLLDQAAPGRWVLLVLILLLQRSRVLPAEQERWKKSEWRPSRDERQQHPQPRVVNFRNAPVQLCNAPSLPCACKRAWRVTRAPANAARQSLARTYAYSGNVPPPPCFEGTAKRHYAGAEAVLSSADAARQRWMMRLTVG